MTARKPHKVHMPPLREQSAPLTACNGSNLPVVYLMTLDPWVATCSKCLRVVLRREKAKNKAGGR